MRTCLIPSLLILGLAQGACGSKSLDKKSEDKAPLALKESIQESPILGDWKLCLPMLPPSEPLDIPTPAIKSVLRTMTFRTAGDGFAALHFYSDDACAEEFGPDAIQNYIQELEAYYQGQGIPGLPPDVIAQIEKEYSAYQETFQFRLDTPTANEGNLDLIKADGKTSYTRYKVSDRMLQIADTCDADTVASGENPDCTEVIGESPDHRPTEYTILLFK
jgi:hypothetical protein